jgi:hypothetical protein
MHFGEFCSLSFTGARYLELLIHWSLLIIAPSSPVYHHVKIGQEKEGCLWSPDGQEGRHLC